MVPLGFVSVPVQIGERRGSFARATRVRSCARARLAAQTTRPPLQGQRCSAGGGRGQVRSLPAGAACLAENRAGARTGPSLRYALLSELKCGGDPAPGAEAQAEHAAPVRAEAGRQEHYAREFRSGQQQGQLAGSSRRAPGLRHRQGIHARAKTWRVRPARGDAHQHALQERHKQKKQRLCDFDW